MRRNAETPIAIAHRRLGYEYIHRLAIDELAALKPIPLHYQTKHARYKIQMVEAIETHMDGGGGFSLLLYTGVVFLANVCALSMVPGG